MTRTVQSALQSTFPTEPESTKPVETPHRRISTDLPAPATLKRLKDAGRLFPQVNCYQPPIIWDRAVGYQVYDEAGNCWIDFSSTAVMTNSGHGHPAIRQAIRDHAEHGLLAQFNFASDIRVQLAEKLLELAPPGCERVYFWTVGSEANEAALRLVREWGMRIAPEKYHVLTFTNDFHGWTLGAHQLSGESAQKAWLPNADSGVHHLPFPRQTAETAGYVDCDWAQMFDQQIEKLASDGVSAANVAGVFIETLQGWGALPFPVAYMQRLRDWADENGVLLVFDEVQTGFGRTGKWFAHEHYDVRADLICIGKGVTSSLPLAALLGPADVLDTLPPAAITTTHAAHPLSCAAALANLKVLEEENLIRESARKGEIARRELEELQSRFPNHIAEISGLGLLQAIHVTDPRTGEPSPELARDWTWAAVKQGVMLFQVNRPTLKVCPPLVIPDEALVEAVQALGDALESMVCD